MSKAIVKAMTQFGIAAVLAGAATGVAGQQDTYTIKRQQALVLEQQGNVSDAEATWQALSKTYPGNPEPYARLGLLEAHQEHYTQAAALYRKALSIDSKLPGLRLNLGLALFKGGDLQDSIPEFAALLKNAPPDSADAQRLTILIGMAHYGLGQYKEAASFLKQAAAKDTTNLPLRLALAHSYLWSKQYQSVMDVYREILTLNAESAEADMLAGEALDEMQDKEGATKMFRAAVKANPKEPNVHFGLGYLLWAQRQYPEAVTEFQAELANDPAHAQSTLYLGDAYLQMNRAEEARPLLQKAIELDPSLWLAHLDLGIMDSDAGRNEDAVREMQAAERLQDNDVNVHWRLARLYRTMGRKDDAKMEFDKASKLNKAANEELYKKMGNGREQTPSKPTAPGQNP